MLVATVVCFAGAVEYASSQSAQTSEAPQTGVVLTKLSDPVYPPVANAAHITGDVDLKLIIGRDGRIESAVVVSGHPMLKQAALDSAQRSQFECRSCGEAVTAYTLKYKFQITSRGYPKDCYDPNEKQPSAEVDLSRHQVTVSAWVRGICDPAGRILKVRSAKCLYLWRCGRRDED
jgi:TonB family protein